MSEAKQTEPDTLMQIWQICQSPMLSKDAKLAFVMLVAPDTTITDAIRCYCDPPEDTMNGLYELARKGFIRLEVNGNTFSSQVIRALPPLIRVGIPVRTQGK